MMNLSLKNFLAFLFLAACIGSASVLAATGQAEFLAPNQEFLAEALGLEIDESEKDNAESDLSTLESEPLSGFLSAAFLPLLSISQPRLVVHYQSGIRAPPLVL